MKQFTAEEIQNKFESLPKDVQDAITSSEINISLQNIGNKHLLHIDQIGQLVDMVGLVMMGLIPSESFVSKLAREIEIPEKTAQEITNDINTEIFSKIRSSMQSIEEHRQSTDIEHTANDGAYNNATIKSLEQAGGFTIEKEGAETLSGTISHNGTPATSIDYKEKVGTATQNPVPSTPVPPKANEYEQHTEPLVDHLLTKPTSVPEEKIVQKVETVPIVPPAPTRKTPAGPDLYREPIE